MSKKTAAEIAAAWNKATSSGHWRKRYAFNVARIHRHLLCEARLKRSPAWRRLPQTLNGVMPYYCRWFGHWCNTHPGWTEHERRLNTADCPTIVDGGKHA